MFCEKCGAQNNDYDYVCAVCGAPLNNARMMQSAYAPTARTKKRVTDRAAKMFMLINAILSLVMVCMPFLPLYVETIDKKSILEKAIKKGMDIEYNKDEKIMQIKK